MHQSDNGSDIVPILTQKGRSDTISDAIGDNKLIHSVQFSSMLLRVYLATPQQQPQHWEILTHSQGNGVGLEVEIAELVYP